MNIIIRRCRPDEVQTLQSIAIQTYYETFEPANTPENMKSYLEQSFNIPQLVSELATPSSEFYFLLEKKNIAAYLKINNFDAQTDVHDNESLEVQRLYVLKEFQRKGYGERLIRFSCSRALQLNKKYIWLGVWEFNKKARNFYNKLGFTVFGSHDFVMGNDHQKDLLLRKELIDDF